MEKEWDHLRQWAEEEGLIFEATFKGPERPGGQEHEVRFDRDTGVWWKYTKPHSAGLAVTWEGDDEPFLHNASPSEYLERLLNFNEVFGDDVRVEGLWRDGKSWRIITTQRDIPGEPASPEEILTAMHAEGWRHISKWDGLGYEHSLTFQKGDGRPSGQRHQNG